MAQLRTGLTPGLQCEEAIAAAALESRIPKHLMSAIGVVETGRPDRISGTWRPWPWAINAEGAGRYFESKAEAIAAVRLLQASGVRSIDVGCMQVNLMHHPDAFASLDQAFDPRRNASYAGQFLNQLFRRSGDWTVAAGWYHSTTPMLAAKYAQRVSSAMPGGSKVMNVGSIARLASPKPKVPTLSRDGTILPSVRLNASGMVPVRATARNFLK
ncbi:MAG: hypothetical protein AB7F35_16100 [Acetobacteraceae bacterium]